ncbi:HalOD1 output domain-containing protein [Halobaculum magnesiiphilum]|uniref:Halobacterial output domain-containing protein n=1 Tax=Halobaculum magnesiiphilum TaxID=1017351 RepID=A0A8T8WIE7_9EURY|nr:HalOD1 output domain-containing protein [Halobaculum magnesiiphilum]QZP39566.1 hypothetical protein K6T50_18550 [Halobaculum magnesiiphilum]
MSGYSVQIVQKVADKEDMHPTELDCTLGDVVDPDALNQLIESLEENDENSNAVLRFGFCGYTVSVSPAGNIEIH